MKNTLMLLAAALLLSTCGKGPETVTVQSNPNELFEAPDSVAEEVEGDTFRQLKLGEVATVESLDPLFAESDSEFRVLGLIYDGLVKLDDNGGAEPAVAARWEVNADSTRFTFHLNNRVYFHDSSVFGNGNGRRVVASDVTYVFNRMASPAVPSFAGAHFSDIRGFEQYQNELLYVKDPAKRAITSIEGLQAPNDSTVVFIMKQSAPDFLQRLAHPRASIYAKESVNANNGPVQRAVGTGAFNFVKKEGNAHILTVNEDYNGTQPPLDRLDIVSGLDQRNLFQEFARGNLDALVEVSPPTLQTVADSTGALLTNMYADYQLTKPPVHAEYPLYFNESSGQREKANALFSAVANNALMLSDPLGTVTVVNSDSASTQTNEALNSHFTVTQTNHPISRFLVGRIAAVATQQRGSFGMSPSYAVSDMVTFTTRPYRGVQKILSWQYPVYVLSRKTVSGIEVRNEPWNLDLSEIEITEAN